MEFFLYLITHLVGLITGVLLCQFSWLLGDWNCIKILTLRLSKKKGSTSSASSNTDLLDTDGRQSSSLFGSARPVKTTGTQAGEPSMNSTFADDDAVEWDCVSSSHTDPVPEKERDGCLKKKMFDTALVPEDNTSVEHMQALNEVWIAAAYGKRFHIRRDCMGLCKANPHNRAAWQGTDRPANVRIMTPCMICCGLDSVKLVRAA